MKSRLPPPKARAKPDPGRTPASGNDSTRDAQRLDASEPINFERASRLGHKVTPQMLQRAIELVRYDYANPIVVANRAQVLRFLRINDQEYDTQYVAEINGNRRLSATLDYFLAHGAHRYGFLQASGLMADLRAAEPNIVNLLGAVPNYPALAGLATRNGMTLAEVQTVMAWKPNLTIGPHVRIRRAGQLPQICHHYAFGGFQGPAASFNIENLAQLLNVPMMTYEQYAASEPDPLPEAFYQGELQKPNFAALAGETVDISAAVNGVENQGPFPVRIYDEIAHSARLEGGRWWHKYSTLPFLISIDGNENLGCHLTAQLNVRSSATAGEEGDFTL